LYCVWRFPLPRERARSGFEMALGAAVRGLIGHVMYKSPCSRPIGIALVDGSACRCRAGAIVLLWWLERQPIPWTLRAAGIRMAAIAWERQWIAPRRAARPGLPYRAR